MSLSAYLFGAIMGGLALAFNRIDLAIFFVLFAILHDIESIERRTKNR